MGVRGELFSTKVSLQNRTYFFNVKENRLGDLYLNIVESKNRDEGGFERQSIILFAEDLQEFLQGFDESLKVLEKATREKRKGPPNREGSTRRSEEYPSSRPPRREDGDREERPENPFRRERPPRPRAEFSDRPERPKRQRSDGNDREWRDEAPRRTGGEPRSYRSSAAGTKYGERSNFRDKQARKGEGQGRPRREDRKDRDKSGFPPKKRVVVKKD